MITLRFYELLRESFYNSVEKFLCFIFDVSIIKFNNVGV